MCVCVCTIHMGDSCIIAATPAPAQGGKKWEVAMGDCALESALYFRYNGACVCIYACGCVCCARLCVRMHATVCVHVRL